MVRTRCFLRLWSYLFIVAFFSTAVHAADSWSIKYVMNGGNAVASLPESYTTGVGTTISGTATKDGAKFLGWCTSAALSECDTNLVIPATDTGDKTIYAKWQSCAACNPTNANCELNVVNNSCTYTTSCKPGFGLIQNDGRYDVSCSVLTYDISYDLDGGIKSATGMPDEYTHGIAATVNGVPTKAGHVFSGWCTGAGATGCAMTQTIATSDIGDKTFYANWVECAACAPVNGTCKLSVKDNACVYDTACDAGYTYADSAQAGKYNAQCQIAQFTLTYKDGQGGSVTKTQNVIYGTDFTPMADNTFTNPGYRLANWSDGTRVYYPGVPVPYVVNSDSAVEAMWTVCAASDVDGECGCPAGTRPDGTGNCTSCTISCGDVTGFTMGTYNQCLGETSLLCYRDCISETDAKDIDILNGAEPGTTISDITNSETLTGSVTKDRFNTCQVAKCADGYFIVGNTCKKCPAYSTNCGTTSNPSDFECPTGHAKTSDSCIPDEYTITLNKNGGTGVVNGVTDTSNATVTCKHGQNCALLLTGSLSRNGAVFAGWGTDAACTSGGDALVFTGSTTVYACWGADTVQCQSGKYYNGTEHVDCPSGWYCPGTGTVAQGSVGCRTSCLSLGTEYTTSDANATTPEQCMKPCDAACEIPSSWPSRTACTKPETVECLYDTTKVVDGMQYYNSGVCVATAEVTACPFADLYCSASNYLTETVDANGYDTYSCVSCKTLPGTGGVYDRSLGYNSMGSSDCYRTCYAACIRFCPEHATCNYSSTNASSGRDKYTEGVCTAKAKNCPIATIACDTGYVNTGNPDSYAAGDTCEAGIFAVTLDANGGDSGNEKVYLQYETGWFNDSDAMNQIGHITPPTRKDYIFMGYSLVPTAKNAPLIAADGTINLSFRAFTADTTLYALWQKDTTECVVGKYYNGTEMVDCPDGQYCPGVGEVEIGTAGCSATCPAGTTGTKPDAASESDCLTTCPAPKTISNGTLANYNEFVAYDAASKSYPTATKCLYTVTCTGDDYVPVGNATTAPSCKYSPEVCPENSYCNPEPATCPDGGKSAAGDVLITDCYKIFVNYSAFKNGQADAKCNYNVADGDYTSCAVIQPAHSCIAGYWHKVVTDFECVPVDDKYYSEDGAIVQTVCPAGAAGSKSPRGDITTCYKTCALTVDNSESVTPKNEVEYVSAGTEQYADCSFNIVCNPGYTVQNNNEVNPTCVANEYVVTLDKNDGKGTVVDTVTCTFDSGVCALPDNASLTRDGYTVVRKWCSADGKVCYDAGTNVAGNISATGVATTLYAQWTPNIYAVILSDGNASTAATPGSVYLKYATGWFEDAGATTPISKITPPTRYGYELLGYFTTQEDDDATDDIKIIAADGTLLTGNALTFTTSAPATLYAHWEATFVTCDAGSYYGGTGIECLPCQAGHWCPGGDYKTDTGSPAGHNECPNDGQSPANSTAVTACYKTVDYVPVDGFGAGTQRCFYDESKSDAVQPYVDKCDTQKILKCNAGYWLENTADIVCTPAGQGYYSAADVLTHTACETYIDAAGTTQAGQTADDVAESSDECFATNLGTYTAPNVATGTQTCSWHSANLTYSASCKDMVVTRCNDGYYMNDAMEANAEVRPNCVPVTVGFYGPVQAEGATVITARAQCPKDSTGAFGITSDDTAGVNITDCYSTQEPYETAAAIGIQECAWSTTDTAYTHDCNPTVQGCAGGYWLNKDATDYNAKLPDCTPVGLGNWSAGGTTENPKMGALTYQECPQGQIVGDILQKGTTQTTTSSAITQCYLDSMYCEFGGGNGTNTCSYVPNEDAGGYTACNTCTVSACPAGTYLSENQCAQCEAGYFCTAEGGKQTCPQTHPKSAAGTTDIRACYRDCTADDIANGTAFTGSVTNGGVNTCAATACDTRYTLSDGKCNLTKCSAGEYLNQQGVCTECPKGNVCLPATAINPDPQPQTCASLTGGEFTLADAGTTDVKNCYRVCTADDVANGTTFTGKITSGGANTCRATSCEKGYSLTDAGKCELCQSGYVCDPNVESGKPQSCESLTDGVYTMSQSGASSVNDCYRKCVPANEHTTVSGWDYYGGDDKDTCVVTACAMGWYEKDGACTQCEAGYICNPTIDKGQPKSCSELTGGAFTESAPGTTNESMCYRQCTTDDVKDSVSVTGVKYESGTKTCKATVCKAGYSLTDAGTCGACPKNHFCNPDIDGGKPQSCATLTKDWPLSDATLTPDGVLDSADDCYRVCESYPIEYGTAIPLEDKVYYDAVCTYRGESLTGNPCEIIDGVCIETECNSHYELISGHCMPCNREHAASYKPTGNCEVESCAIGYHPEGDQCKSNVVTCTAPNAADAEQVWDSAKGAYGICMIKECQDGYHVESNVCESNIQPCDIENGVGEHEWNTIKNAWGECVATSCDPGYTSDRSEMDTRDGVKQCGRCRNAFGVNGDLAVDKYRKGCAIASCLYQGQLYDLQNNECVPICEVKGYEDETGFRQWNPRTQKCEIECNPGYKKW